MKTFVTVLGLISFQAFLEVSRAKSIKAGCSIQINSDLPEPQPLLLIPGGSKDGNGFFLPEDGDDIVTFAVGEEVLLACAGENNYLVYSGFGARTALATCGSDTTFYINQIPHRFSEFACRGYPYHVARKSGSKCHDGTKSHIEIGFEVESDFYKIIDICFDDIQLNTLYSKFTLVSSIGGYQVGFPRPSFIQDDFYPELSVDDLYTKNTQRQTISAILGSTELGDKYVAESSDYFLARGHHTAKADFVYGSQHRATFHFVNVSPQWQTFNGANWNALEMSVRTYADKNKLTLDVYTGTYGVATLPNVNGIETELYLYIDDNNNKGIPVPKLFWKAVYNPKTQAGIVFVGINNPYVSNPQEDYLICNDVCSKISWLQWDQENIKSGYSYCCDVDDFRSTVTTLPEFEVSGLLI